jgi:hypothetical protein
MSLQPIRGGIFDVPVAVIGETDERANKSTFFVLHTYNHSMTMPIIYSTIKQVGLRIKNLITYMTENLESSVKRM